MPLQRDDSDERIARLEKMMEEGRAKSTPDVPREQREQVVDVPKPSHAKAGIRRSARKTARGGAKSE
jgi:hypothetical protein